MTNYTLYDSGGIVMAIVRCAPDELEANMAHCGATGHLEGSFHWSQYRVQDGQAVPLVPTLEQLKAARWEKLKAARNEHEFGGFTWDGSTFDSDAESQSRIQGAAQLATLAMLNQQAFSIDWTLADNTVRTLSGADMLAVGTAMGVHISTAHATGRVLREAIEAATTVEQLEGVAWPT